MMYVAVAVVSAAASAGATWQMTAAKYQRDIAQMRLDSQQEKFLALEAAAAESARLQAKIDEAVKKSTKRQQVLARDADAARAELERLQDATRAAADRGADACPAAAVDTAALAWVLGRCTGRVTDLATKADGHVSDIRTLMEAWPKCP